MIYSIRRLRQETAGSAAIEFAFVAPILLTLFLGVLQVGLAMQAYNALRGVAADVGRYVAVENQKANPLTNEQIRLQGTAIAVQPPYLLASNRVAVSVSEAPNQRVTGATELRFRISYVVPTVLRLTDFPELTIRYRQNLFVSASPAEA